MEMFAQNGVWTSRFLFLRKMLNWTSLEYSYYRTVLGFTGLFAQFIAVPVMANVLKFHDSTISLLGMVKIPELFYKTYYVYKIYYIYDDINCFYDILIFSSRFCYIGVQFMYASLCCVSMDAVCRMYCCIFGWHNNYCV